MKFTFDLQRFDEVAISAGDTYALDGVTYTALEDARLNLDDDGKVSGVVSGSVTATVTGRSNPVATVDATNSSTEFTLTGKDEVLTLTKVLPFELDNGTFTLAGNVLTAAKGSDLRIGTGRTYADGTIVFGHDYADTDITYTITDTTLTEETEKETIIFTASLGEQARSITTFVNGKIINGVADGKFTGGFTITKGSSMGLVLGNYTVKATANADATSQILVDSKGINIIPGSGDGSLNVALSRNGTEIISGELNVTGGKITFGYDNSVTFAKDTSWDFTWNGYTMTATTTDEATLDISLTGNKLSFTPGQNDGGVTLVLTQNGTPVFGGVLNVTDGTITFDPTTQKFSFTEGTNISLTIPGTTTRQVDFKVTGGNASIKIEAVTDGKFILTPDDNDGSLQISVSRDGRTVFQNTFSVSNGSIVFDPATQAVTLTQGTTLNVTLNNYTISATATDDASFRLALLNDGRIAFVPGENDGALDIAIKRGNTTIFQNTVSVSGAIFVNPETLEMTLTEGTNISLSFGNYELNATTTADATVGIAVLESGIAITPTPGDGSLNLTINSAGGSLSANVEVISGSFILGDGGLLTVAKDTELKIDFGDGYVINFKATDDAGGSLVLGANGITFVPGTDDGGLQLSITRDGQTRTAFLDVTGSVTYSLDGSISLAKGTVVRNVFDSGNVLTITANTDASGSIVFTPQRGLDITPSTPDALNVVLETDGVEVVNITSIDGSINYTGGVVTASDGTKAHISYYFGWESELRTTGGTASLQFTADRTVYTANEGATFVLDYLDGTTTEIQNGTYSDIYATETSEAIELVSEGSIFKNNDNEQVYTLEKAGNYILNGMNIATTQDGVQVQLSNYDTVMFEADAGIVFDGQEFSGDGIITLTNGAIVIANEDDNVAVNGTALNDNIINSGDNVTLTGGKGDDRISLDSAANNLIRYASGDGDDSIYGFGNDDTISISGAAYSTATSGNDLVLNVGSDYVTLFGAASLDNPHIIIGTAGGGSDTTPSTQSGGGSSSTTSGGGSSSTTSGGSSSSTTSGGGSSSTTSGGGSSSTTSGGGSSSTTSGGGSSSTTSGGGSSSTTSGGTSSSSNRIYYGNGNSNSFTFRQNSHSTTADAPTTATTSTETELPSLITQSKNSTSTQRVYTGGDQVITNYTAGEKITLGTSPTGGAFVNGNFILSSASGNLVVQNAAGKVIDFIDGNGNDYIKAYEATAAGVVDGRGLGGFELINGSAGSDWIYAGSGGSSLWGGSGNVSDMLVGGAGTDIFVGGKYQGADVISNAETKDIINISDATLSDIIATAENNGLIAVTFNNGNAVAVQSSEALSAAFQLADGSKWRYNHATKGWQSA